MVCNDVAQCKNGTHTDALHVPLHRPWAGVVPRQDHYYVHTEVDSSYVLSRPSIVNSQQSLFLSSTKISPSIRPLLTTSRSYTLFLHMSYYVILYAVKHTATPMPNACIPHLSFIQVTAVCTATMMYSTRYTSAVQTVRAKKQDKSRHMS